MSVARAAVEEHLPFAAYGSRARQILALLEQYPYLSVARVAKDLNITSTHAAVLLYNLHGTGKLGRVGTRGLYRYTKPEQGATR